MNEDSVSSRKPLRILLDIDGTITYDPTFFSNFAKQMRPVAEIHIVSHRPEEMREETIEDLRKLGIEYDFLELTSEKLRYALEHGINVVFEDYDHYIKYMPEGVTCFKIREKDNWHWKSRKWIYSDEYGIHREYLP